MRYLLEEFVVNPPHPLLPLSLATFLGLSHPPLSLGQQQEGMHSTLLLLTHTLIVDTL